MKSKRKIILLVTIILSIILILIPIKSYCSDVTSLISAMSGASDLDGSNKVTDGINTIYSLVRFVGSGISIIVVIMLGIKYMIASVEDKADIKKRAIPIVIGCVILFATTNLMVIIQNIVGSI